ncbi:MAG: hypothetical protein IT249_09390 [Chitinophagaceae bacterium]|nr:hypothetical protein [Chitinophagaceae bacterium]
MKKFAFLFFVAGFVIIQQAIAQDENSEPVQKGFDKSKLFFGGNFGLGFGTNTSVNISPQVGYRFNDFLAAGAGVNFNYYSYKSFYTNGADYSRTSFGYTGFNVFGRVYPIKFILLQAQPELNYSWGSIKYYDGSAKYKYPGKFVPSLLVGGGAAIPMGGRNGALLLMIQYDVLQEGRSPYGNRPFFSMGYNF